MPRLTDATPKYRKKTVSGHQYAYVTISGKEQPLGPWKSAASKAEYDRLIGEWLAAGRQAAPESPNDTTVAELILGFWTHAETYYGGPSGKSGELDCFKLALRELKRLYGHTVARDFGPLALENVRMAFVKAGWVRTFINRQVSRIRQVFRWGESKELIPKGTWQSLKTLEGLRENKSDAAESRAVRPVAEAHVEAVLALLAPQLQTMIRLQMLTGARPGEVCQMRTCDVDTTGKLWVYKPATHKTRHHGHQRTIYLGDRCQELLRPWLRTDLERPLFSPIEADEWQRRRRSAARKTPLSCGNRPGTNRVRRPDRAKGDRYTTKVYSKAVLRACDVAFPPPAELARRKGERPKQWYARLTAEQMRHLRAWRDDHRWHPHQIRHTFATNARREYGLEAAQVLLGHKSLKMAELYAEKNVEAAMRIMGEVG